jgi:hypothetical protein
LAAVPALLGTSQRRTPLPIKILLELAESECLSLDYLLDKVGEEREKIKKANNSLAERG